MANLPLNEEQVRILDKQFLELFIKESPGQRFSLHPTLEEAIAKYELKFADVITILTPVLSLPKSVNSQILILLNFRHKSVIN